MNVLRDQSGGVRAVPELTRQLDPGVRLSAADTVVVLVHIDVLRQEVRLLLKEKHFECTKLARHGFARSAMINHSCLRMEATFEGFEASAQVTRPYVVCRDGISTGELDFFAKLKGMYTTIRPVLTQSQLYV